MPVPPQLTPWKPGQSGNPNGRPSGRADTLRDLDEMLAKAENRKKFQAHLQVLFDKNPVGFWERFVIPLLPKQATIADESGMQRVKMILECVDVETERRGNGRELGEGKGGDGNEADGEQDND